MKLSRRFLPLLVVPAALAWCELGGPLLLGPAQAQEFTLSDRINAALLRLGPYATCAVRVVALDGGPGEGGRPGEVLYERNPDLSLSPASNMKLVTTAAALAKLGPDYRFTTEVLSAGKRDESSLNGDLVLRGGGDSSLETPGLADLADQVRKAGIRTIRGDLLADDYRYDAERLGNGWNSDDEPFYYSAQISALSVNRNVLQFDVAPAMEVGQPARVTLKPLSDYLQILERPTSVAATETTRVSVTRERARNEIRVRGRIAVGGELIRNRDVSVEEPELFTAALFRKLLEERGVQVKGKIRRARTPEGAEVLASRKSPQLSEMAALLNKPSDNLMAEMLLKELGTTVRLPGTASNGGDVAEAWLKSEGIETGGVAINDGSGLSRQDLLTARVVTELLARADRAPWKPAFVASLPVMGVDGTLRNRMKATRAEGAIVAKTGSLAYVSALGGYTTTAGGRRVAFSVLINNYRGALSAKRVEDTIALALVEAR